MQDHSILLAVCDNGEGFDFTAQARDGIGLGLSRPVSGSGRALLPSPNLGSARCPGLRIPLKRECFGRAGGLSF